MSCLSCELLAEDCWDEEEESPCTCSCHDSPEYHRASGGMTCSVCKKAYREHPHGGPVGMNNQRFLRRLCDDSLVKL